MLGRTASPELLRGVRSGQITDRQFIGQLVAAPAIATNEAVKIGLSANIRSSKDHPDLYSEKVIAFAEKPSEWRGSIFGSDAAFAAVQAMAREGRIVVVQADLNGKRTLKKIGRELKRAGVTVSAVDISNAANYFVRQGGANFLANLGALPLAKNAKLLLTNKIWTPQVGNMPGWSFGAGITHPPSDGWLYFAVPVTQFLAEKGVMSGPMRYLEWLLKLLAAAKPKEKAAGLILPAAV